MLIQSTLLPKQKQQNQKTDKKFHWSSVKKKNENFYRYMYFKETQYYLWIVYLVQIIQSFCVLKY